MKVLVIGGTGFISGAVVQRFAAEGDEVVLFNRGRSQSHGDFVTITGDVASLDKSRDALRAVEPDVVVHSVAYSEQDGERLVDVFDGSSARLVVLGSQDCYEGFHAFQVGRELTDFPIQEDDPLAPRHYWKAHGHPSHASTESYDKNLMTAVVMAAAQQDRVRATVLRLPMVWGPLDPQPQYRHGDIVWHLLDAQPAMVIGAREQAQVWTYGYIDNVAAAIVHAAGCQETDGGVYNLGETRVRTRRRWAELFAHAAGRALDFLVVPDELLEPDKDPNGPAFHLMMDDNAFVRETGFRDPVSLDQGIERTLAWSRDHEAELGPRPDYEGRLRLAHAYADAVGQLAHETK
jgi:nucleoside-diphosphate-sugar epimerase